MSSYHQLSRMDSNKKNRRQNYSPGSNITNSASVRFQTQSVSTSKSNPSLFQNISDLQTMVCELGQELKTTQAELAKTRNEFQQFVLQTTSPNTIKAQSPQSKAKRLFNTTPLYETG